MITMLRLLRIGIHFGYLDMTQENILDQAKKLVGMAYGWGDSNGDMDCSSTMNAIYRCFGIILPRNTGSMAQTGTQIVSLEGMTQEEKLEKIQDIKVGSIVEGTVESLQTYGAFIDLGDHISGLVHVSQISEKRIKSPKLCSLWETM